MNSVKDDLPQTRIIYSWLLQSSVSSQLAKIHNKDDPFLTNDEQAEEYAKAYRKEWSKHEYKILTALCERLNLKFNLPIIDCYLADYFVPMSDPLILNFRNEPDQFVDVLVHELTHVLLTDNNKYQQHSDGELDLVGHYKESFGDYSFNTLIHIPVHAAMKYIFLDIFKDEKRLSRDIGYYEDNGFEDYIKAWDYVQQNDYQKIIDQAISIYS